MSNEQRLREVLIACRNYFEARAQRDELYAKVQAALAATESQGEPPLDRSEISFILRHLPSRHSMTYIRQRLEVLATTLPERLVNGLTKEQMMKALEQTETPKETKS